MFPVDVGELEPAQHQVGLLLGPDEGIDATAGELAQGLLYAHRPLQRNGQKAGSRLDQQIPLGGHYAVGHVGGDDVVGIAVEHVGHLAETAGAEAIGQQVGILQVADGGQAEVGGAGDHPGHGPGEGIDGDPDADIRIEIVDGAHQIHEGTCLVGIDQPRQFAEMGIENANRLGGGGGLGIGAGEPQAGQPQQGEQQQEGQGGGSGHGRVAPP